MSIWFRKERPQLASRSSIDEVFGQHLMAQGIQGSANVNGGLIENAQQSVAIRSSVDLIASLCSELPIDIYTGQGIKRRQVAKPGYLEDPAGDGHGLEDWLYQLVYSWLYRGNGYGEVLDRGPSGMLRQVDLFNPDKVSGYIADGEVKWQVNGRMVPAQRMMHRRVNPVPGQIEGLSVITAHADTIGVTLAASRFGKGWFDSDAQPTGILRNNLSGIDPTQATTIKQRFMAALGGKREPVVMGRGWEWQSISVTPEESQFLGTMGYSESQCARMFGPGVAQLLGYEVGGSLTYANIQDFDVTLLKYSVNKWLRRLERVLFDFLPRPQYAIFNRDALLETNTMQRYLAYASALQGKAWKTVDEVREKENLPAMPEEDVPEPTPSAGDSKDPETDPVEGEENPA